MITRFHFEKYQRNANACISSFFTFSSKYLKTDGLGYLLNNLIPAPYTTYRGRFK